MLLALERPCNNGLGKVCRHMNPLVRVGGIFGISHSHTHRLHSVESPPGIHQR